MVQEEGVEAVTKQLELQGILFGAQPVHSEDPHLRKFRSHGRNAQRSLKETLILQETDVFFGSLLLMPIKSICLQADLYCLTSCIGRVLATTHGLHGEWVLP